MRIKYELLAIVAMLGVTAALLRPIDASVTAAESARERPSLEALAPRHPQPDDDRADAGQARARAIDAQRLRLVANGELTAREVTPAELRQIRSGALDEKTRP